jgi:hypothetical protein
MITEVYEALISAGADEQKAKDAAKAISERDNQLATRADISSVRADIKGVYFAFGLMGAGIAYLASLIHTVISNI